VEASRAGEAGAGFAVVAEEVRNLARLSGDAAHRTADLLAEATKRASEGQNTANRLSEGFVNIEQVVKEAVEQVQSIGSATQEQTAATDSVNTSMASFNEVIQQNHRAASQSKVNSEELSRQSEALTQTATELVSLIKGRKEAEILHQQFEEAKNKKRPRTNNNNKQIKRITQTSPTF
jgi:methyl-accepting chemotaxis protein